MQNPPDLSIIIVTWNSQDWIRRCLDSIYKKTSEISFEVIVIDNNSKDRTIRAVMEFNGVKVIENKDNKGWSAAVNQGVEASGGRYLCVLNPDTELYDRTMEQLVAYMEKNPEIGMVGPHLMNEDESTQVSIRRRPRLLDQLMIILKLHVLFPDARPIYRYLYRDFNYRQTQEVEQIMGAAMFIRRRVFDQVGLFDESFFLWFDEVDFCLRVYERTDYKIFYNARIHLIHAGGASFLQVGSLKKQRWYLKSLRYFFRKHGNWGAYLIILFFTPLSLFLGVVGGGVKKSNKGKKVADKTAKGFKTGGGKS